MSATGGPTAMVRAKPRPPSASTATTTRSARPRLRPRSPPHREEDQVHNGANDVAEPRPPHASGHSLAIHSPHHHHQQQQLLPPAAAASTAIGVISPRIMREEIETQRKITRQAQRDFNALVLQLAKKRQEVALIRRHVATFEAQCATLEATGATAAPASASTSASPSTRNVPTMAPSPAPEQGHEPTGPMVTAVDRLREQIRRIDAYKKKLRHLLERLHRHVQFLRANTELLEARRTSTNREVALFQDKVAQERSLSTELEFRLAQLIEERETHAQHARQLLDSLREEITSRSLINHQRQEADQRREEMLRLVQAHSAPSPGPNHAPEHAPLERHNSIERRGLGASTRPDSFRILLQDSQHFQTLTGPSGNGNSHPQHALTLTHRGSCGTMRRLQVLHHPSLGAGDSYAAFQREAYFQVYEMQYARVLEQTGEADIGIIIERYTGFDESLRRLQQIERDLIAEHDALERKRQCHQDLVHELRLSGIAEVEKRKRIRDFLEQQHHFKGLVKSQAKETYLQQLKTYAYVQQGMNNIAELLKCLDDRATPPPAPPPPPTSSSSNAAFPGAAMSMIGTSPADIEWFRALVNHCLGIVRNHACSQVFFTTEEVERLGAIDPMLGVAASCSTCATSPAVGDGDSTIVSPGRLSKPPWITADDEEETDQEIAARERAEAGADSDTDSEPDRERIKLNETNTLVQVQLLLKTLEAQHQPPREPVSQRLRRALGLTTVKEDPTTTAAVAPQGPLVTGNGQSPRVNPALTPEAKLAAVHAFFREKRARDKHELQYRREMQALHDVGPSGGHVHRSRGTSGHLSGLLNPVSASRHGSSSVTSLAMSAFGAGPKPRKRSNAVTFGSSAAQTQGQSVASSPTAPPRSGVDKSSQSKQVNGHPATGSSSASTSSTTTGANASKTRAKPKSKNSPQRNKKSMS